MSRDFDPQELTNFTTKFFLQIMHRFIIFKKMSYLKNLQVLFKTKLRAEDWISTNDGFSTTAYKAVPFEHSGTSAN